MHHPCLKMSMSVKGNSQGTLNHSTTFWQPQVPYGIFGLKAARNKYQNGMEGMDIGEPQPNQQPNQQLELKMDKDLKGLTSTQTPPHILNHHLPTLGSFSAHLHQSLLHVMHMVSSKLAPGYT
ncbi:hypothetical protein DVH24_026467 [Malus domestica]|uniref:Uncharacterized protein n=1 Tax=Malus domestica TaxID=3750 RepID=A0A498KJH0_MALDO|nr:hypothetical protein DVH24_026467 [Malus domestica]